MEVNAGTTKVVLILLVAKTLAYAVSLGCGFRGGPIFPAVFLGVGLASLPVVWFDASPTLAVAVGAAAGMAAQTRLLFAPVLFATLLVGKAGLDATPAAVLATAAAWLTMAALDSRARTTADGSVRPHRRRGVTPFVGLGRREFMILGRGARRLRPHPVDDRPDDDDDQPDHDDPAEHRQRTQRCHQRPSSLSSLSRLIGPQASAFAFRASNSCCVIAPLSSSSLAFAISPGRAPAEPRRGDRPHVLVEVGLRGLRLMHAALGHALALGDHVDQHTEERQDDQEHDPRGLPPARDVAPEEIAEDRISSQIQATQQKKMIIVQRMLRNG